jgi:WD40 repeat protein
MKIFTQSLFILLLVTAFGAAQDTPELLLPRGHSGQTRILTQAMSADLRFAYTVGNTGDVKVWDAETGQVLRTVFDSQAYPDEDYLGNIRSAAFSPQADWVVTLDEKGVIRRFSVPSGKMLNSFQLSPDDSDGIVKTDGDSVWLVTTKQIQKRKLAGEIQAATDIETRNSGGHSVALSSDGKLLAVAQRSKVVLYQTADLKQLATLDVGKAVRGLAISPEGDRLVVTTGDEARLVQVPDLSQMGSVPFQNDPSRSAVWRGQDVYIYGYSLGGRMVLARLDFESSSLDVLEENISLMSASLTPDSRLFLGGFGGKSLLLDPSTGERKEFSGDIGGYSAFTIDSRTSDLFTGSRQGEVVRWSSENGRITRRYEGLQSFVASLDVSPDGTKLLGADYSRGLVVCWDLETGEQQSVVTLSIGGFGNGIQWARWVDSERYLYSAPGQDLTLVDASTGQTLNSWSVQGLHPHDVAIKNGRLVAGYSKYLILEADIDSKRDVSIKKVQMHIPGSIEAVDYGDTTKEVYFLDGHGYIFRWLPEDPENEPERLAHFEEDTTDLEYRDGVLSLWLRNGEIRHLDRNGNQISKLKLEDGSVWGDHLVADDVIVALADYYYLSFYDAKSGARRGRLVGLKNNQGWLALEESGSFDGNDVGLQTVHFSLDGEVFGVDQFLTQYLRPGILAELIPGNSKNLRTARPLTSSSLKKPPEVRILEPASGQTLNEQSVSVKFRVSPQGSGASEPSLFHNGHKLPASGVTRIDESNYSCEVQLVRGKNEFLASAFDGSGAVESRRDRVRVYAPEVQERPPRLHLLSVGIDNYDSGLKLQFATNDAQSISELFQTDLYAAGTRKLLANEQATREGIQSALSEIASGAEPQDAFVFYLAGHGTVVDDIYYFLPRDVQTGSDQQLKTSALSAQMLSQMLASVPATKQLLVLDTCRAGKFLKGAGDIYSREGLEEVRSHNLLSRTSGTFLVAATKEQDYAYEVPELGHGILTYSVLESMGLKDGKDSSSPITANGLLYTVSQSVPELSQKYHGTRQMVVQYSTGQDFPLTR